MTPKEKAKELIGKMYEELPPRIGRYPESEGCALIAVYEIIEMLSKLSKDSDLMFKDEIAFWEQTIQEINSI